MRKYSTGNYKFRPRNPKIKFLLKPTVIEVYLSRMMNWNREMAIKKLEQLVFLSNGKLLGSISDRAERHDQGCNELPGITPGNHSNVTAFELALTMTWVKMFMRGPFCLRWSCNKTCAVASSEALTHAVHERFIKKRFETKTTCLHAFKFE